MVNEFCGFKQGVIGTDKMPADTTLNNMKKADLIKLLHTAQHNYETLMWFYNNAVKVNMAQLNNNGWIACSKSLPEIDGCTSDTVLVCTIDGFQHMAFWCDDNKWRYCASGMIKEPMDWTEVIAWQPLPAPYMPKGE